MTTSLAVRTGWLARVGLAMMASACGCNARPASPPQQGLPPFAGVETDRWLVERSGPVGRDDVLPAFEASAKNYGCRTEEVGSQSSLTMHGERRSYYGVTASCYDGTVSIITLVDGSVLIGCAKPITLDACNELLRAIAESR